MEKPRKKKQTAASVGAGTVKEKPKPKPPPGINLKKLLAVVFIMLILCGGVACLIVFYVLPMFDDPCATPSDSQSEYDILLCERIHAGVTCSFDVATCTTPCILGYEQDAYECPISCKCAGDGTFETDVSFNEVNIKSVLTSYIPEEDTSFDTSSSVSAHAKLWDIVDGRAVVPYVFANDVYKNLRAKTAIEEAIEGYANLTCIDFRVRSDEDDFLEFVAREKGCRSFIGRMGGRQIVSIGAGCARAGVVQHELLHALGFWHEQSRPDRDAYVTVKLDNVAQSFVHNFKVRGRSSVKDLKSEYDIKSVMHYGGFSFSKNRQPTIVDKVTGKVVKSQRKGLSSKDIKEARVLYNCADGPGIVPQPGDAWGSWGDWGVCSASCGKGTKVRVRSCRSNNDTIVHDRRCGREYYESDDCEGGECGEGKWGEWSPCSVTCGGGSMHRESCCDRNSKIEKKDCSPAPCISNDGGAMWGVWGAWSGCSATCGGGWVRRRRPCMGEANTTVPVQECPTQLPSFNELQACATEDCDGTTASNIKWGVWGEWSSCSRSCDKGVKQRYRDCEGGFPGTGSCVGEQEGFMRCVVVECPLVEAQDEVHWGPWWAWSHCSASCGSATRTRTRVCYSLHYKAATRCVSERGNSEVDTQLRKCDNQVCVGVYTEEVGVWGAWLQWGACTKSCGGGAHTRYRVCIGEGCEGNPDEVQPCNTKSCYHEFTTSEAVGWGGWSAWSSCYGNNTQTKYRSCFNDLMDVTVGCTGEDSQSKPCRTCNLWEGWGTWGSCSRSCGLGIQHRSRGCSFMSGCDDGSHESRECFNNCSSIQDLPWIVRTHICSEGWTTLARVNNDQYKDVVCVQQYQQIRILLNNNLNFVFSQPHNISVCPNTPNIDGGRLFVADFNGDHLDDILCVYNGTTKITLNNAGGYVGSLQVTTDIGNFCNASTIAPVYLDDEHKAHLLCIRNNGVIQLLPNVL